MKKEINLRNKDFKFKRELLISVFLWFLAALLLTLSVALGIIRLNESRAGLIEEYTILEKENLKLREISAPVVDIENAINLHRDKVAKMDFLKKQKTPWKNYFDLIIDVAGENRVINLISASCDGPINIQGEAKNMEDIVFFKDNLAASSIIKRTDIEKMEYRIAEAGSDDSNSYSSDNSYYLFSLNCILAIDE